MRPAESLILGYGNPARGDDGLGPALIERLSALDLHGVQTRSDYQLRVEDALDLGAFSRVVFVDAAVSGSAPFDFFELPESAVKRLDTHSVSPGALMFLARELFGANTQAFVLAIRGYAFAPFTEGLSQQALDNLDRALGHLSTLLNTRHKA